MLFTATITFDLETDDYPNISKPITTELVSEGGGKGNRPRTKEEQDQLDKIKKEVYALVHAMIKKEADFPKPSEMEVDVEGYC